MFDRSIQQLTQKPLSFIGKLLLKVLYLGLLYALVLMIVKQMTDIRGNILIVVVLSLSVLLMYFTFDKIYELMTKNEIVIKPNEKEKDKENETSKKNSVKTEVSKKVHKETSSESDYLFDHTHKFVQDKVFD